MNKIAAFVALTLFVTGCAKSTLTVSVDLYKGKLAEKNITSKTFINQKARLESLSKLSQAIALDKKNLAEAGFDTYRSYLRYMTEYNGATFNERDLAITLGYKEAYLNGVDSTLQRVTNEINAARSFVTNDQIVSNKSFDQMQFDVEVAIAKVEFEVDNLIYYSSDYDKLLLSAWQDVSNDLSNRIKAGPPKEATKLSVDHQQLKTSISRVTDLMKKANQITSKEADLVEKPLNDSNPTSALNAVVRLTDAFAKIPALTSENRIQELAVFSSSRALLFSQLDRLQDFGHADWKFIADNNNNDQMWSPAFTKTVFEAEGNSSIVLVRDSPVGFRPQQVNNDPSSLIQSQLQITRGLSNMFISVAGSISGFDINGALGSSTKETNEATTNTAADEEEDDGAKEEELEDAYQSVAIEKKQEFRKKAIESLIRSLTNARNELDANWTNATNRQKILDRINTLTEAYKKLLSK